MKLYDLDNKNSAVAALKANFDFKLDTRKLTKESTKLMLGKVRKLIKETKASPKFHENQTSPSYLKLVFMEQALVKHLAVAKSKPVARIVVENEEVEKSQVILAAQDLVDSVQKMIEEVNDMLVKELPALTDSIQSEIGVNESTQFAQQAGEALTALNQTLSQSKTTLQNALNQMTGIGGPDAFGAPAGGGEEMAVTDIAAPAPTGGEELGGAEESPELPAEEPEEVPTGPVGRAKR